MISTPPLDTVKVLVLGATNTYPTQKFTLAAKAPIYPLPRTYTIPVYAPAASAGNTKLACVPLATVACTVRVEIKTSKPLP